MRVHTARALSLSLIVGFLGCSLVAPLEELDVADPSNGGTESGGTQSADAGANSGLGGGDGDPAQGGSGSLEGGSGPMTVGGTGGEPIVGPGGAGGEGTAGAGGAEAMSCKLSTDCDDDNDCTEDRCEAQLCIHINENAPGVDCDDKNSCTTTDKCVPNTGLCQGNSSCNDNDACTHSDQCTAQGACQGVSYTCPTGVTPSTCNGAGACACPQTHGRLCTPPADPSSGCFPQCCPGEADRPETCGPGNTHTSRCANDGVLICVPP